MQMGMPSFVHGDYGEHPNIMIVGGSRMGVTGSPGKLCLCDINQSAVVILNADMVSSIRCCDRSKYYKPTEYIPLHQRLQTSIFKYLIFSLLPESSPGCEAQTSPTLTNGG